MKSAILLFLATAFYMGTLWHAFFTNRCVSGSNNYGKICGNELLVLASLVTLVAAYILFVILTSKKK